VPRHPPNALTSLTTENVALSAELADFHLLALLRVAPAAGQAINQSPFRKGHARVVHDLSHQRRLYCLFDFFEVARSLLSICLTSSSSASQQRARSCFALRSSIQLSRLTSSSSSEAKRPANQLARVGQERFELSTPRLSSVCSNQLSYWPVGLIGLSRPNSKPWHRPRRVSVDRRGLTRSVMSEQRIIRSVPSRLTGIVLTEVKDKTPERR
jgi:hypothetical protein